MFWKFMICANVVIFLLQWVFFSNEYSHSYRRRDNSEHLNTDHSSNLSSLSFGSCELETIILIKLEIKSSARERDPPRCLTVPQSTIDLPRA